MAMSEEKRREIREGLNIKDEDMDMVANERPIDIDKRDKYGDEPEFTE